MPGSDEPTAITFTDGSTFTLPEGWRGPWQEKWAEKYQPAGEDMVAHVRAGVEKYFTHHMTTDRFCNPRTWKEEGMTYATMAALAEDMVYAFLRFYILRAVGREHGVKVMDPAEALKMIAEEEKKD